MKIIGVGFGRTGTTSIKAALEQIGLRCYHMFEVLEHAAHLKVWGTANPDKPQDWKALFADYQATVDWPACNFYKQLMVQYPDAHVLLTVRDPEAWYESTENTLHAFRHSRALRLLSKVNPRLKSYTRVADNIIWQGTFSGRFAEKQYAIDVFNRHIEEVKKHVPADRLLVYDVREGWAPLCGMLAMEAPKDTPFPHLNDTASFQSMLQSASRKALISLSLLTVLLLGLAYYFLR